MLHRWWGHAEDEIWIVGTELLHYVRCIWHLPAQQALWWGQKGEKGLQSTGYSCTPQHPLCEHCYIWQVSQTSLKRYWYLPCAHCVHHHDSLYMEKFNLSHTMANSLQFIYLLKLHTWLDSAHYCGLEVHVLYVHTLCSGPRLLSVALKMHSCNSLSHCTVLNMKCCSYMSLATEFCNLNDQSIISNPISGLYVSYTIHLDLALEYSNRCFRCKQNKV